MREPGLLRDGQLMPENLIHPVFAAQLEFFKALLEVFIRRGNEATGFDGLNFIVVLLVKIGQLPEFFISGQKPTFQLIINC